MAYRCPEAEFNGVGVLPDYKLALDEKGFATVIPCEGSKVYGVIWRISEEDEKSLDRYEGVKSHCYKKKTLKIRPDGYFTRFPMLVYVSLRDGFEGKRLDGYMEKIVVAAKDFGFPVDYIKMLESV